MRFPAIYKTKGIDPKNGKPNIVALMVNQNRGISIEGGSMAPGVGLSFGGEQSLKPEQWDFVRSV